jgi:hypothetical protein
MSRYQVSAADEPYAIEFKANLESGNHFHSPGLQRVLNVMRGGPKQDKYVLLVREARQLWLLGRLPGERGDPVEIVPGYEFTDLNEAEWTVFQLRWETLTGKPLAL